MKLTFDEALIRFILKNHRNLLIASLASICIIFSLSFVTFNRLTETQTKVTAATSQIAKLKSTFSVSTNLVKELKDKVTLLNVFLPNDFDLLLMLNTIEEIGNRTNFKIRSVSLGSEKTHEGILAQKNIVIIATGTFESFLNFLKEYKAVTGQIISMASVSLSGKEQVLSNLSITMYAYKPKIDLNAFPDLKNLDKNDRAVLDVVTKYVKVVPDTKIDDSYQPKTDPFQTK